MTEELKDKIKGMIFGLIVGDCLGAYLEFTSKDNHEFITDFKNGGPHRLRAGDWTDDTAMTLAIMDSIVCCNGEVVSKDIMEKFYNWYNKGEYSSNGRCFDIGYATIRALESWKFKIYQNQSESKGNGSIMRIAPTIALDFIDNNYDYKHSLKVSNLTHNNLYVQYVVKSMCDVIFEHLNGERTTKKSIYKSRKEVSNSGIAGDTFNAALWAFNESESFEDGLIKAVNLGGDSDSIGAVYGQIAGSYYGYNAIPNRWKDNIIKKYYIDNLINNMIEVFEEKGEPKWQMKEENCWKNFAKKAKHFLKHLTK